MARNVRTYDHFCLLARALERVGDRWSLLVVRDLLSGAKRFTDLMGRLGGITPKTLTTRLRELERDGVVRSEREPGRREVWYRLTPAGEELGPVVDALSWWGLRHAWRAPRADEPLHAEHLLRAVVQVLDRVGGDRRPVRWHIRLVDDGEYTVGCDGDRWSLASGAPDGEAGADVTVTGTTASWSQYLVAPGARRPDLELRGAAGQVARLESLLAEARAAMRRESGAATAPARP